MNILRSILYGMLGTVVLVSLVGKVSSQPPDASTSSLATNHASSSLVQLEDTFIPDSLTSEDDDSEEQYVENPVHNSVEVPELSSSSMGSSKPGGFRSTHEEERRLLLPKDAREASVVPKDSSRGQVSRVSDYTDKPSRGASRKQHSSSVSTPDTTNSIFKAGQHSPETLATEEEKLLTTTRKLVKWLRNRLQKRLGEVAGLKEKCEVEKKLLLYLNETIKAESDERQTEIKEKLETQNELKDIKSHLSEPDKELNEVRKQNSQLFDQLTRQKKIYEDLADTRKKMEDRLVLAGFAHWLDKRGQEYMPATAVGVLSKSAQLLDPLSRGLQEIVKFDERFSIGVGSVIPISERSLLSKLLRDLALLLPIFPVLMLMWQIKKISQRLSILHLIMYISMIFAIESSLAFGFSLCVGGQGIREMQKSYELFVVTAVFIDVMLFTVMAIMQLLVLALRTSRSEIMQSLLIAAVGVHFFRTAFQPIVMNQLATTTTAAHGVYAMNFLSIAFEKKSTLKVGTRFDKHLNSFLLSVEQWVYETFEAMKNLFEDTLPDLGDDDTISTGALTLSSQNRLLQELEVAENHALDRKEADVAEVAKALNASKGYARWTTAKTSNHDGQGRSAFRGVRWSQMNPQLLFLQSRSRKRAKQHPAA